MRLPADRWLPVRLESIVGTPMSDSDKPDTPPAPAAAPPAPTNAEATPEKPAGTPSPTPSATPPAPPKPGGGPPRPGKRPPPRGGDMPNRRMRESVPSLDDDMRYTSGPKIKDLDAEIAGE